METVLPLNGDVFQDARRHHGREREGYDRGNDHGDRQRDREFAEETAHDAAHQEERNEYCDQRDGERQDGEADLLGAFEGRLHRGLTFLDVA